MKISVVTTFSPQGYEVYGRQMMLSYEKFWPEDIPLHVFWENGGAPVDMIGDRFVFHPLDWDVDRRNFIASHTDHPTGFKKRPIKFSHKVFAVTGAPRDCDWLIFMDADIETIAPVTHEFLASILPNGVVASFLGRKWWTHTETGFVAYRMSDEGQQFLDDFRQFYIDDKILELAEQHDSAAFDYVRQTYEAKGHKFHDLAEHLPHPTPNLLEAARRGDALALDILTEHLDVMSASKLGRYLWHNKGKHRKMKAYGAVA